MFVGIDLRRSANDLLNAENSQSINQVLFLLCIGERNGYNHPPLITDDPNRVQSEISSKDLRHRGPLKKDGTVGMSAMEIEVDPSGEIFRPIGAVGSHEKFAFPNFLSYPMT